MRVSNLLDTEDLTVGEIKGGNLEERGQGFISEVVLATALLQWSFRLLNPVETALEFVREKIAVVADIFLVLVRRSCFLCGLCFTGEGNGKNVMRWEYGREKLVCFLFWLCHVSCFSFGLSKLNGLIRKL